MLNIYKNTTYSSMYYSYCVIRGISDIIFDILNNLRFSFLIMRSGFVIMRCRSSKWRRSLFISCGGSVKRALLFLLCIVGFFIIRRRPLSISGSKIIIWCGHTFPNKHPTITPLDMQWRTIVRYFIWYRRMIFRRLISYWGGDNAGSCVFH